MYKSTILHSSKNPTNCLNSTQVTNMCPAHKKFFVSNLYNPDSKSSGNFSLTPFSLFTTKPVVFLKQWIKKHHWQYYTMYIIYEELLPNTKHYTMKSQSNQISNQILWCQWDSFPNQIFDQIVTKIEIIGIQILSFKALNGPSPLSNKIKYINLK